MIRRKNVRGLILRIVLSKLDEFFSVPFIANYSERFTFLEDELDVVKFGLFDIKQLSKPYFKRV